MRVDEYVKNHTSGERIKFKGVLREFKEFLDELISFDQKKMQEEWQDTVHFFQLWLFWKFEVNGEIWKCTSGSVAKFMGRLKIWREIYKFVGLNENISNFCGNYNREEKVIKQLGKFGISSEIAKKAYNIVVLNK